jgi:DNA repair protein RecO (recombination protein O)
LSGDALLAAMYVNELVLRLSGRNDAHADAFGAYAQCLSRLVDDTDMAWTLRRFERDFLAHLGYALALTQTATEEPIDPDADYSYDPESGASAWRDGSMFPRIAGAALLALDRDDRPKTEHLAQLRRLIRTAIRHLVGAELNAWVLASRRTFADDGR